MASREGLVGRAAVALALVVVIAGCRHQERGGEDAGPASSTTVGVGAFDPSVPVAKVAAGPPGTALGAGFVVAEGSTLVGPVSPVTLPITRGVAGTGVRWQALLWVSDDLPTVVDRYLAQGEALGLRWVGVGPTCTEREGAYRCRALGVGVDERGRAGELVIQGSRLSGAGGTTQRALVFTWRRPQEGRVVTGHPGPSTPEPGGSAAGQGRRRDSSMASPKLRNRYPAASAVPYRSRQRGPTNASTINSSVERGRWKFVIRTSTTCHS